MIPQTKAKLKTKSYPALLTKMNILKLRKIIRYLNEINLNIVT